MAFIPVSGIFEVVQKGRLPEGRPYASVFNVFGGGSPLTQSVADDIAGIIAGAYSTYGLAGVLSTGYTADSWTVTDLTSASAPQFTSVADAFAGGSAAQPLPPGVAAVISWHTGLRGRSFNGRTFQPGFTEDDSDGHIGSGVVVTLEDFAAGLIADLIVGSHGMEIVSRFSGTHLVSGPGSQVLKRPLPRAAGVATAVTNATVSNVWHSQRRRAG